MWMNEQFNGYKRAKKKEKKIIKNRKAVWGRIIQLTTPPDRQAVVNS